MDINGADFFRVIKMMKDRLKTNPVPIQLPIGKEDTFRGIIDLVNMEADVYYDDLGKDVRVEPIPADMVDLAHEYRQNLIESVSESDEELFEKFCAGEEPTTEEIKRALRKETIANKVVPVVCGTSYRNKGVQKLLDAIVDYMPAPTDVPHIRGTNPETDEEEERPSSDDAPFAALAFKIMTDPYVGKLCFFRVYSGSIKAGDAALNAEKEIKERFGRILQMHANERKDIEQCYAGDIAAIVEKEYDDGRHALRRKAPNSLSQWNFRSLSSRSLSNRKQRQVKKKWVLLCQNWQRKTRHSKPIPTKTRVRPSSPAWASFTWISSLTDCSANSRSRQT
jgi:elongation factor G